ncbi:hypothetical protein [Deinococcus sp.]|uniref:hypothetical protein n=1 Tax=Deinococcus sp. TaxID=47478 RepID=UPI003CC6BD74
MLGQKLLKVAAMVSVLSCPASALTLPLAGWTTTDAGAGAGGSTWTDSAQACVLREDRLSQPFPSLPDAGAAGRLAVKMQKALLAQHFGEVVTQPVARGAGWAVLAAYTFAQDGVQYRAVQLFLSDAGKLRTVTGSYADGEASPCVNELHDFLRNTAK